MEPALSPSIVRPFDLLRAHCSGHAKAKYSNDSRGLDSTVGTDGPISPSILPVRRTSPTFFSLNIQAIGFGDYMINYSGDLYN